MDIGIASGDYQSRLGNVRSARKAIFAEEGTQCERKIATDVSRLIEADMVPRSCPSCAGHTSEPNVSAMQMSKGPLSGQSMAHVPEAHFAAWVQKVRAVVPGG